MSFGTNLQYLRKMNNTMTQDQLAEKMSVSRQTISKWEADEAYPEMEKLIRLCELFSCTMDDLLRKDMKTNTDAYSPVQIKTVERFRMARYVIISPQPENDVLDYINRWAEKSGLTEATGGLLNIIGWDFPFVSSEQQNVYGLRGYAAAAVLPDHFSPKCGGAEIAWQESREYAVITITEPFKAPFELIPNAYKQIMKYLDMNGIKKTASNGIVCFERVYHQEGVCYMDVFIAVDSLVKTAQVYQFR